MSNVVFKSLREVCVDGFGHSILITPEKPMALPPILHSEAYALGCVPVLDKVTPELVAPVVPESEPTVVVETSAVSNERADIIEDGIRKIIAQGDKDKLTLGGYPRVGALREVVALQDLNSNEIEAVFLVMDKAED